VDEEIEDDSRSLIMIIALCSLQFFDTGVRKHIRPAKTRSSNPRDSLPEQMEEDLRGTG